MKAIRFKWDGEAMHPAAHGWAKQADMHYTVGETYTLGEVEDRSQSSHNHFFASLNEAYDNLPESGEQFKNAEAFRKRGLIETGFCTSIDRVFTSEADAKAAAALVKSDDEYAVIEQSGCVVRVHRAESQSRKAMGNARFKASKQAVLDWAWALVGTDAPQRSAA